MDPSKTIRTYRDAVAIVTGGASGTGKAVSEELVKRGCEVVIADRQSDLSEEIASKLHLSGGKTTAVETDVTSYPALEHLVVKRFSVQAGSTTCSIASSAPVLFERPFWKEVGSLAECLLRFLPKR